MNSLKTTILTSLILLFLLFSFYPTIFELQRKDNLADSRREFILEHNYYWPDYNLYLSKIRQGIDGKLTAVEKYTGGIHKGSLIQEFYVVLGWLGKVFNLTPNDSYLLGRIILAPLLLLVIWKISTIYYPSSTIFQLLAFLIVIISGSFPKFYTDSQGIIHTGRFMEWWSNIDALQRITFIPHILFGQVVSFYLLYQIVIRHSGLSRISKFEGDSGVTNVPQNDHSILSTRKLIPLIFLGNLAGLTFPPSLITLNGVLILMLLMSSRAKRGDLYRLLLRQPADRNDKKISSLEYWSIGVLVFIFSTLPSLLYIFFITKFTPWSALVDFHRTHPMMIPFDQYILGTGPIFFLGIAGAIVSIIKRDKKFQPLIFWILATFGFAAFFSVIKDQSPLRFTQTGLFIPLGLLGAYFFYQLFRLSDLSHLSDLSRSQAKAALILGIGSYLTASIFMMKTSLDWQTDWISQRIAAFNPAVPYPPQSMYPLREWMDGIRWLKNNTNHNDVVLAEITAANHIPAYSGNFVYWGQSNTVDYDRKEKEADKFFSGKMSEREAQIFLANGRIKYIFFSVQEKEKSGGKDLETYYPFLKTVYTNPIVTIYSFSSS